MTTCQLCNMSNAPVALVCRNCGATLEDALPDSDTQPSPDAGIRQHESAPRRVSLGMVFILVVYLGLVFLAAAIGFEIPITDSGWGPLITYAAALLVALPWSVVIFCTATYIDNIWVVYGLLWGCTILNVVILIRLTYKN